MKKVLVMGINGTFGRHTAKSLIDQGYEITALMRDPKKLPVELVGIKVIQGDVQDKRSIAQACKGIDIVVYGVNPPGYDWKDKAIPYLDTVLEVVKEKKMTIIFPGNVYVFDPAEGSVFDEQAMQHPRSEKGEIRTTMEESLRVAAMRGAKVVILRMGDFIAPNSQSSWLSQLIKANKHGVSIASPGPATIKHSWAYVPDAACVVVQLIALLDTLPAFNVFHLKGLRMSISDIASAIETATGKAVRINNFPWWIMKLGSPFSVMFRGLLEMRYLWNEEVHMSDQSLRQLLPNKIPETDFARILLDCKLIRDKK